METIFDQLIISIALAIIAYAFILGCLCIMKLLVRKFK